MTADEPTTGHAASPPTTSQLLKAWETVGRPDPVGPVLLHLAAPVDVAVTAGARATSGLYTLRGRTAPARGLRPGQVALDVTMATRAAARRTDRYLNLDADPSTWIKVLRSGVHRVAYGADLLFGFPPLLLADNVDPAAAKDLLRAWRGGELRAFPALFSTGGQLYVAEGNHKRVVMNSVSRPASQPLESPADQGLRDVGSAAASIRHELDARACSVTDVTAIEGGLRCRVLLRLRDGTLVRVPIRRLDGILHIGHRTGLDLALNLKIDLGLPAGFDRSADDGAGRRWIRHQASGLVVELMK